MIVELRGGDNDPFDVEGQNPGLWNTSAGGPERFNEDVQRPGGFLGDGNDGTYIYQTGAGLFGAFRLFFPDYQIPEGAQVRHVQFRARATAVGGLRTLECKMISAGTIIPLTDVLEISGGGLTDYFGAIRTDPNSGRPWGQIEIELLMAIVGTQEREDGASQDVTLSEFTALLNVNMSPTITITGPTGSVASTSRPSVTWTYSDAEGDAQERYRVRVFSQAQYESSEFHPAASLAYWDSGLVFSSATSAQTGRLPNGAYRAYVVVGDVGSSGRLTLYNQYVGWTQAFPPPGIPTVVATSEPTDNRVRLDLTSTPGGSTTTSFVVQRSMEGGAWINVADIPNTGGVVVGYDYTAPRQIELSYRAIARHSTPDEISESAPGPAVTTTLDSDGQFWLKSLSNPSLNSPVCVSTDRLAVLTPETQAVFRPWGRPSPVIMSSGMHGGVLEEIPFTFTNDAEYVAFAHLRDSKETLLLQTCYGDGPLEQFFIRLGETRRTSRITSPLSTQIRSMTVAAYEVEHLVP